MLCYMVIYTVHGYDDSDNNFRNIVKHVLDNHEYMWLGTTTFIRKDNMNNEHDVNKVKELCNIEKKKLVKDILELKNERIKSYNPNYKLQVIALYAMSS